MIACLALVHRQQITDATLTQTEIIGIDGVNPWWYLNGGGGGRGETGIRGWIKGDIRGGNSTGAYSISHTCNNVTAQQL